MERDFISLNDKNVSKINQYFWMNDSLELEVEGSSSIKFDCINILV